MKHICVFCGSSYGADSIYVKAAKDLGHSIVKNGYGLVYGGAEVGLMGEVANTVLYAKGTATGVIPKAFASEVKHNNLTNLYIVDSMHERKAKMYELSDAFIALPGGFGTLEEILETLTWAQLGFHKKPCGILNTNNYYNDLIKFIDNSISEQFVRECYRDLLIIETSPDLLLERFKNHVPKNLKKWVGLKKAQN